MKILITGGAGFIGSWLLDHLSELGHESTVLDNLSEQVHGREAEARIRSSFFQQPGRRLVVGDVRDRLLLDSLLADVEAVVHLAAETGTGQSMYEVAHYIDINARATALLFELIGRRHRHIRKVVLASSRSVYGEGAYLMEGQLISPAARNRDDLAAGRFEPSGPCGEPLQLIATPEHAPLRPASIYAASKQSMEEIGRICSQSFQIGVLALRFQNVYGERQSLKNPYTGILSIFSNRMRSEQPINIFEDGHESRDFVHVSDVSRAISSGLEAESAGFQAVNIGSGVATSVLEIAQLLARLLESRSQIRVSGDFRMGDIRHCYADLATAERMLGFRPSVGLQSGLQAFCEWVKTQPVEVDRSVEAQRELAGLGLGLARE